jgi:hypothetical protein
MYVKALITIRREHWASVKYFATLENMTISRALEILLLEALTKRGHLLLEASKHG